MRGLLHHMLQPARFMHQGPKQQLGMSHTDMQELSKDIFSNKLKAFDEQWQQHIEYGGL